MKQFLNFDPVPNYRALRGIGRIDVIESIQLWGWRIGWENVHATPFSHHVRVIGRQRWTQPVERWMEGRGSGSWKVRGRERGRKVSSWKGKVSNSRGEVSKGEEGKESKADGVQKRRQIREKIWGEKWKRMRNAWTISFQFLRSSFLLAQILLLSNYLISEFKSLLAIIWIFLFHHYSSCYWSGLSPHLPRYHQVGILANRLENINNNWRIIINISSNLNLNSSTPHQSQNWNRFQIASSQHFPSSLKF